MWEDPIVKEVREAGEELAKNANYDLHILIQNLKKNERKQKVKIVSLKKVSKGKIASK